MPGNLLGSIKVEDCGGKVPVGAKRTNNVSVGNVQAQASSSRREELGGGKYVIIRERLRKTSTSVWFREKKERTGV